MRSTGETGTTWTEEGMGRREKKDKSWERWTSRQIDRGRLTGPLPTPTKHPRPGLWLLDSHLLEGAEVSPCLRMGAAGHISRPPRGWPSCRQRGSPIPSPCFRPGVHSSGKSPRSLEHHRGMSGHVAQVAGGQVGEGRRWALTDLPGPRVPGPAPLPPAPRPRLALGVLPQLLLMTCSCRSARSARSRSSSMNCCSRSLALASRAAVSFRNWSICTTSLGPEQSLTPVPQSGCPPTLRRSP